jgi:class 3 adenylate cyclase
VQTVTVVEPGDVRIGDDDRQAAIDALRRHTGAGRLTLDEFAELAGQVFAARTRGELDHVLDGLPGGLEPSPGPASAGATVAPVGEGRDRTAIQGADRDLPGERRRFVAIMCGARARGRWRAPPRVSAFAFWGHVTLDLRHALIEGPVVDVWAWAIMGGVDVVVPEGIPVELDGLVVMGGTSNRARTTAPVPRAPVVRVHARGLWGGVSVRTRPLRAAPGGGRSPAQVAVGPHGVDDEIETDDQVDDAIDGLAAAAEQGSWPPSLPSPPPAVPPWVRHPGHGARVDRSSRRHGAHPPAPGLGGLPLDLRDLLPRFLTEDRVSGHTSTASAGGPSAGPAASGAGTGTAAGATPRRLPGGTLTILVTDMVGSTALAEELGDRRWWEILQAHNVLVRDEVERHGGVEVKAQGDGFLVVFSSARQAILAAVAIQRAVARYRGDNPSHPVELRIGLHTGEMVEADGDVFGQNVIVAVRIADAASPGDVLVSGLTRDLTAAAGDLHFGPGEDVSLKGFSRPWRVHRVTWN